MRSAGITVALVATLGSHTVRADDPRPKAHWKARTHLHHAGCVHRAVGDAATGVSLDEDRGEVDVEVDAASCAAIGERLLDYGVDAVDVDGQHVAVLDAVAACDQPRDPKAMPTTALAMLLLEEQAMFDALERVITDDSRGGIDARAAADLAHRCPSMIAALARTGAMIQHDRFSVVDWVFRHDHWTGKLSELTAYQCPRVLEAADRIRERAGTHRRLRSVQAMTLLTSPDGFYVRGARTPTLGAALARTNVWYQVEDATHANLVDLDCPVDSPAVTRYTRYQFGRAGRSVKRTQRVACAAFDPRELR